MAQQTEIATSVTLQETATVATVSSVEAPPDIDSSEKDSPSSPEFSNNRIGSVLAQETEDAAVVAFEKTATIAAVNSFEVVMDNDSSPQGSACDGSANQDELSDIEPPPGLENGMIAAPVLATSPPMLPFDVMATFHTAWNDSTVLSYGPNGSPKKAHALMPIGGMSMAADPILAYGPHGSPKRRACNFEMGDAPVFGYGPHGSPKRRANKTSTEESQLFTNDEVFGYGPHGSPKRRANKTSTEESQLLTNDEVFGYGPHGSPKRRASKGSIETFPVPTLGDIFGTDSIETFPVPTVDEIFGYGPNGSPKRRASKGTAQVPPLSHDDEVLGYGPHGSPKRRAGKENAEPSFSLDSSDACLAYAPSLSPRKICQDSIAESIAVEPGLVASTLPTPIDSVFTAAKRESIPLKVNMVSESLKVAGNRRSPSKAMSVDVDLDRKTTSQESVVEKDLDSTSPPKDFPGIESPSKLSAGAPEFVPGVPQPEFSFSPAAAEFVPCSLPEASPVANETTLSPFAADFVPGNMSVAHLAPGMASQHTEFDPSAADFVLNTLFAPAVAAQETEFAPSVAELMPSTLSVACLSPAEATGWNLFDASWSCARAW